jgi:hypothetical protein
MHKVRCDLTGQESEWFDPHLIAPKGWATISFSYSFYKGDQYFNGTKRLSICPDAIAKLIPDAQPCQKEDTFMDLLRGFIQDEIADALANQ